MFLPIWPKAQKYNFNKTKIKFSKIKVEYIENFFAKKYNSKYCVLTSSARVGIVLTLRFKKFSRSKIVKIPKWSPHCLNDSIGSISNISCDGVKADCKLVVHYLGHSFKINNKRGLLIDDSSDSLPNSEFKSCINSNISEVVSLPKIIGSYCGGIILTNNKSFFSYLKKKQNQNHEFAAEQSKKKYECLILNKMNFEWHYNESFNYGLDFNTSENIYENLKNFEINKEIIKKRQKLILRSGFISDKYRIGPCLLFTHNKRLTKILDTRHINVLQSAEKSKFIKKNILPIHFTISDKELEKKLNDISKN
jgi:hypothetical protein